MQFVGGYLRAAFEHSILALLPRIPDPRQKPLKYLLLKALCAIREGGGVLFRCVGCPPGGTRKVIFGRLFDPGQAPRPPGRARAPPDFTESNFHRFLDVPGRALRAFGHTLGTLWPPSASFLRTGVTKKKENDSRDPSATPRQSEMRKRSALDGQM